MGYVVQRLGFRITRGWATLLLLAGIITGVAFWIGPLRPEPGQLELLALPRDSADVAVEAVRAPDPETGAVRFAVVPAVRNVGARDVRPRQVILSVPAQFSVATAAGPVPAHVTPGVPLRRYIINVPPLRVPADSSLRRLPGLDSIFIVPELSSWYCTMGDDGIPEFMPAPAFDAAALSELSIFYSMRTGQPQERHSGLLTVHLDAAALSVQPAPMPPSFPTQIIEPEAPRPALGMVRYIGGRNVHCGDPEMPVELFSALYQTEVGGRFFVIFVDGVARKRLYDLNGDGIIELETWDAHGDGGFEGRREARFATPAFLIPPPPRMAELLTPDDAPPDTLWLALFHEADRGPRRFATTSLRPSPRPVEVDSTTAPAPATFAVAPEDTAGARDIDPQWLALFDDVAAGPRRFAGRVAPADMPPPPAEPGAEPVVQPPAAAPPVAQPPVVEQQQQAEPPATQTPPRRRVPLGTPVPTRPPPPDTLRG